MDIYEYLLSRAKLFYTQGIRKFAGSYITKKVSLTNFNSDMDKRHYLIMSNFRVTDGNREIRFNEYVRNQIEIAKQLNIILEYHISHTWFMGSEVFLYDLVIDIEKAPIRENIEILEDVVNFLKIYGMKAVAKISSIIEKDNDLYAGFHIHVDLSSLEPYAYDLGGVNIIVEKWEDFYDSLIDRLERITEVQGRFDRAYKSREHMIRGFLSPKVDKDNPSKLLGFSIPINIDVLKDLVHKKKYDKILNHFRSIDHALKYRTIPRGKVINPKLFQALFEGLTGNKISIEIGRRIHIHVEDLPYNPLGFTKIFDHSNKYKCYEYIDRVLEKGLRDGRKRFIMYCAARYLVNVKKLKPEEAINIIMEFIDKSTKLPGFKGSGKIYASWVRSVVRGVKKKELWPYKLEKLKEKDKEVYQSVMEILSQN